MTTQKDAGEKETAVAKYSRKILTSIPSAIPPESIKLTKLPDGYKLSASHNESKKDEEGSAESLFIYETEEHYGASVKDIKGGFNSEGVYEVNIGFESE
jgi:hypothetical protein